ncbi:DMT family transporter [Neptunomonas sp. XY-337]|uniref:DMT family transporter n=1 Tax=Neptunomonas sp. XY-337 TaxID=2561897 RepID=UPI00197DD39C|nr:DMT family transporter [Neptunomonas sp. XY-337]
MQELRWTSVAFIIFGMSLIPLGDSAGKILAIGGMSPLFIAWSRLSVGFVCLLPFSRLTKTEWRDLFNWRLVFRACLFSGAISCILSALKTEPIGDVFGVFFIGPIVAYFLAAIVLKEPITLARSLLLFAGFGGVLLVVKPGFGMSSGLLLALAAGTLYGCMLVTNRWLASTYRPRVILLSTLLFGSLLLAPKGLSMLPTQIDGFTIGLVLVSSLASALGNLIIIDANRRLNANVVAPFVYSQLVAAVVLGVLLFSELPDTWSMIGLAIIFASGIWSFLLVKRT